MVRLSPEIEVRLRDGSRAVVRPIRPADRERLRRGFERLSPRTRYLRFHAPIEHLSEKQLTYLTEVDYDDHMAFVALDADADNPDDRGMGVARYVRLPDEPNVAEAAVTVVDDYQGRGLGTALLGVLARYARERGIDTLRNYVLAENDDMLQLLEALDADYEAETAGVLRVDMPVPHDPDALPDTPAGHVLKLAARSAEPPILLGMLGFLGIGRGQLDLRDRDDVTTDSDEQAAAGREKADLAKWLDLEFTDEAAREDDDEA